jgi:apolipoprotein N-acyltransferase
VPFRTASSLPRPDLLIWPEGALPVFGDAEKERRLYARVGRWAARRRTSLLTGAITDARSAPAPTARGGGYFTSALLFAPGRPPQQYDKMHLAPMMERVPLTGRADVPDEVAPPEGPSRYAAGTRQTLFRLGRRTFATTIGFESLLGDHVRHSVADGAEFVVALAQNGWWGPAPSPAQHLHLTRLRAVETRRAVVLSTVDGISGLIGPDGVIHVAGRPRALTSARLTVPIYGPTTLYVRHGDWPGRGASYVSAVLALLWVGMVATRPPVRVNLTARKKKQKPARQAAFA